MFHTSILKTKASASCVGMNIPADTRPLGPWGRAFLISSSTAAVPTFLPRLRSCCGVCVVPVQNILMYDYTQVAFWDLERRRSEGGDMVMVK